MLHHHCVTADPQWACNVFSRVICGSSQSRATLDVSHAYFYFRTEAFVKTKIPWGATFWPSLGRTANIVSKSHWPPCDAFHGVSEAFRSLRIPDKLKLK